MRWRTGRYFAILAALLLAGCGGLKIPDPAIYANGCPKLPAVEQASGQSQFFFASLALPDCRDGSLGFAPYRHAEMTFGTGTYGWIAPQTPMQPIIRAQDRADWLRTLETRLATPEAKGRLVVFIHGYNNSFEDAHKMAARISELGGTEVPIVVFHWPSRARTLSYTADEATLAWAQGPFEDVLADLTMRARDVTIVAHSMGVRAGIRAALAVDGNKRAKPENIRKVVLASGDEDRDRALREGGSIDLMLRDDRKVLVYASYRDSALDLSRSVHAYARLGSTDCTFDLVFSQRARGKFGNCHRTPPRPGLAMVSTSRIEPVDHLDHNDFIEDCRTRADFAAFLRGAPPPPFRRDISEPGLVGYEIDPDAADPEGLCDKSADSGD